MPGEVSRNHPMSDLDDWQRASWDEYRQSMTACCPRQTIPDSCSCLENCQCVCRDCDCGEDDDDEW